MFAPNAMVIEEGMGQISNLSTHLRENQLKELATAKGDVSADFQSGYELGLQTARSILASGLTSF